MAEAEAVLPAARSDLEIQEFRDCPTCRNPVATGVEEVVLGISSDSHPVDSDDIRGITSVALADGLDFINYLYYVRVTMRRSLILPELVARSSLSAEHSTAALQGRDTEPASSNEPPIPPPTKAELAGSAALLESFANIPFGLLTPSPEFIAVQLATSSTGFG